MQAFLEHRPDLVVLDADTPSGSSLGPLREIRHVSDVPVVVLSGVTAEEHTVRAFEHGADSFVSKPVGAKCLVARSKAVMRRADMHPPTGPELRFNGGDLTINLKQRTIWLAGARVKLTAVEFRILSVLVQRCGRVISQLELREAISRTGARPGENQLKVFISRLRAKLHRPGGAGYIRTRRGSGYYFTAEDGPEPEGQPRPADLDGESARAGARRRRKPQDAVR